MTTKEIAEAVGQTDRSVRNWITKLAEKSSVVAEKYSASSPSKPADYTLAETCQIIEEGMGADVANTFRTNAANAELSSQVKKPNGAQLDALYKMVRDGMITKEQMQAILGIKPDTVAVKMIADNTPKLPPIVERQVYAVAAKAMKKILDEQRVASLSNPLFSDKE